jgi:hypothetical protein
MIHTNTTWLHGDHHARNFAEDARVTAIQTHRSVLNHHNIEKLMQSEPDSIHVYSAQVLTVLQTKPWPRTTLYTVPSAPADKNLWHTVLQFDPSDPIRIN